MQIKSFQGRVGKRAMLALVCALGATLALPGAVNAQDRGRGGRDEGRSDGGRGRDEGRGDRSRTRDEEHARFTHSQDERRFDNGIALRRGATFTDHRFDAYFPHHYYSYPHYALGRDVGRVVISPFSFYVGIFPPYIDRSAVIISAPSRVFIDVPIYTHGDYRPYGGARDDYYLNRADDNRWKDDPDLRRAVYDLEDSFRNEDIALLAPLTDPAVNISVFAKGRYQYSLAPNDYLDMTRDFLRSAHTTNFTAYRVHPKAPGIYQVLARHDYQDTNGQTRTVYLDMIVQRINDRWTLTQVDTSPAHV